MNLFVITEESHSENINGIVNVDLSNANFSHVLRDSRFKVTHVDGEMKVDLITSG